MIDILKTLNEEQKEAVLYNDGPLLILAGAGTGKTRVLTSKIAYLLEQGLASPHEILAVTFTNKASNEMKERVQSFINEDLSWLWIGTFHSIATRILRKHADLLGFSQDFTIIDQDDQIRLIKQIMIDYEMDVKEISPKIYANKINEWKDKGQNYEYIKNLNYSSENYPNILDIFSVYTDRLKRLNLCDFGDLLLYNLELFNKYPQILSQYIEKFKYILVDEYQDTNTIQHNWLKTISGIGIKKKVCISCVGDDDQSIYGWRGAEIENILRFEKDYKDTKIIRLERNYRSTSHILSLASCLIENNTERHKKTLWTENKEEGEKVDLITFNTNREEVFFIAQTIDSMVGGKLRYNDVAILIRAGYQSRSFEEIFMAKSIPYKIIGGLKFYERKEIKDCIAYLRLVKNSEDSLAFERIVNTPKRGVGSTTLNKIQESATYNNCGLLEAAKILVKTGGISGKTSGKLIEFIEKVESWHEMSKTVPLIELTNIVLYESGYIDFLKDNKDEEYKGKLENINEFLRSLEEFDNLNEFLEYVSLVNDKSNSSDNDNSVNIITIHSAKGLEFDTVFLPSWEEGVFPSPRSLDDRNGLEEERRLAYVAITRTKRKLYISHSNMRYEFGETKPSKPSRFIDELPEKDIEKIDKSSNNEIFFDRSEVDDFITRKQISTPTNNIGKMNTTKRVRHNTFGEGFVIKEQDNQLTIAFKSVGIKKILKSFVEFID